jgi:hypothetical protein
LVDSTGYIEQWKDNEHWPDELQERFEDVEWEKIICKRGTARISDPRLLYGSTGPATTTWRIVLPWFVKVHDDMTTMEIPEMGSYAEIALAY